MKTTKQFVAMLLVCSFMATVALAQDTKPKEKEKKEEKKEHKKDGEHKEHKKEGEKKKEEKKP